MPSRRPTRTAHVPSATLSPREVVAALVRPVDVARAEARVAALLEAPDAVLFASARGALSACVGVLADGPEAAVPAYTCAAVPNAVLSAGRRPVFVDVDERGLVPAHAWPANALPVVQDTYGFAAPAPSGRLFVRDSAHRALPLELGGAAAVVTSFEHSKSLSAGRGGLVVTEDPSLAAELRRVRDAAGRPGSRLRACAVTLWTLAMGRFDAAGRHRTAEMFRKAAWHTDVTLLLGQSSDELRGAGVDAPLLGPPDRSLAGLVVSQLRRGRDAAAHRAHIVSVYDGAARLDRAPAALVRYPMSVDDPDDFERRMLDHGWDLRGRWFNAPLHPRGTELGAFGYAPGQAPVAERLAATVVNLPTHPLVDADAARGLIAAALAAGAAPL